MAYLSETVTARLLSSCGYSFESYAELQEWVEEGLLSNLSKIHVLYGKEMSLNELYARFHGKIVEFCKENSRGKTVFVESLGI